MGSHYESSVETMTSYYSAGGTRVAVRNSNGSGTNGLVYLMGDHPSQSLRAGLGSASLTADPLDGDKLSELRYKAWGETRHSLTNAPTDRRYTGQTSEEAGIGLYYYGARFYDPLLGRFTAPDSIIPGTENPLAWDRYSYVFNNPVKYNDPSGHCPQCVGAVIGGLINTGLYLWNESQQDGFNLKEDWVDAGVALGEGAIAGALLTTPGTQQIAIGMIGNMAGDHIENIVASEDFSAGEHLLTGIAGGVSGYIGGLLPTTKLAQMANSALWGGVDEYTTASITGGGSIQDFASGVIWSGATEGANLGWLDEIQINYGSRTAREITTNIYTNSAVEGISSFAQNLPKWFTNNTAKPQ